jgi:hypothetical protein
VTRESLRQYIVRPPVSLEKLYRDWRTMLPHGALCVLRFGFAKTSTLYQRYSRHAPKRGHFRGEARYFSGLDFIAHYTSYPTQGQAPCAPLKRLFIADARNMEAAAGGPSSR